MRWLPLRAREVDWLRPTVWTHLKQVLLALYGLYIKVEVVGKVTVPLRRSYIVAANHLNGADSLVLQVALRTRLFFATAVRWFAGGFSRFIMKNLCDAIPVETGDALASLTGVRHCIKTLRSGGSIGVYPEGEFNRGGKVTEIHDGAAYLAARTGTPILPVYIRNLRLGQEVDSTTRSTECWTGFLSVAEQLFNTDIHVFIGEPVRPVAKPPRTKDELRAEVARINAELLHEFDQLADQRC